MRGGYRLTEPFSGNGFVWSASVAALQSTIQGKLRVNFYPGPTVKTGMHFSWNSSGEWAGVDCRLRRTCAGRAAFSDAQGN